MKKVFSLINCLLLIFILLSCSNTITIVVKSDKLEDINYTLEKKDNYTVSDLMVFDTKYLFLGYSFNNKDLIDYKFKLNNNDVIYAIFGVELDFFDIKSVGKVFITTGEEINSKEEYKNARVLIAKDEYQIESDVLIRLRGNSTLWVPKKSYKLKFNSKVDIMGMGEDKEWGLLANYFDPTYLRNYYAYKLAISLGLEFSCEVEFVEVYLNNEYQGLYLLSELVKTSKERVNIEDEPYSFLLELDDKLVADNPNYKDLIDDEIFLLDNSKYSKVYSFGTKYPKSFKDIDNSYYEYIKEYMNTVFSSVRNKTFYDYIDIDSFINYYLIQELFMNVDVDYSSVFMYKHGDEKLKFGPIWDFDLSSGNVSYVYNYNPNSFMKNLNGGSYLFETALNDINFRNMVVERLVFINEKIIPLMISSIDKNKEFLKNYAKLDNDVWNVLADHNWARPEHLVNISYEEQVRYFKNFIILHNNYMLANY